MDRSFGCRSATSGQLHTPLGRSLFRASARGACRLSTCREEVRGASTRWADPTLRRGVHEPAQRFLLRRRANRCCERRRDGDTKRLLGITDIDDSTPSTTWGRCRTKDGVQGSQADNPAVFNCPSGEVEARSPEVLSLSMSERSPHRTQIVMASEGGTALLFLIY